MPDITWDGRDLVMDVHLYPSDLDPGGHHGHVRSDHVLTQRINISEHIREIVREELSRGRPPEVKAKAREWGDRALGLNVTLTEADLPRHNNSYNIGGKDIDA